MKKILAMLLVAILAFSATAFAATYRHDDDIAFEYDENAIEITSEVHNDDEHRIVMGYKEKAWGDGYITIQLARTCRTARVSPPARNSPRAWASPPTPSSLCPPGPTSRMSSPPAPLPKA